MTVSEVWKTFRIFSEQSTTLKQAILRRRGATFEEFWALKDVSFEVPAGTTFGIVGGNGAGKSTMLKVLTKILVPDKGSIEVKGKVSALLELGAGFHPELTGRENVFLNGAILGMSRSTLNARFDEIVAFAGLEKFIDNPVKTYSSGMHARLGFSVAVNVDPEILLIDEVLAVGDEQFQRRCSEKIEELRSGGRTVILVSHSLAQVQQICDNAVWLKNGTVSVTGKTRDVVDLYLASVTTDFRLDESGRQRTGTREITLETSLLVDGKPSRHIPTNHPVVVRFEWEAHEEVPDVNFAFAIRTSDGAMIAGSSNVIDIPISILHRGPGQMDFTIPKIALLPGAYMLAASVSGRYSGHTYDHSPNMVEFDVVPGDRHLADYGVVTLSGEWHTESTSIVIGDSQ